MASIEDRDHSQRAALTVAKETNKETNKQTGEESNNGVSEGTKKAAKSRPSPAAKFDVACDEPAARAGRLYVQAQRSQKLHQYYDEALAEIRASLERAP